MRLADFLSLPPGRGIANPSHTNAIRISLPAVVLTEPARSRRVTVEKKALSGPLGGSLPGKRFFKRDSSPTGLLRSKGL